MRFPITLSPRPSAASIASVVLVSLVLSVGCRRPETRPVPIDKAKLSPAQQLRNSPTVAATKAFGFDLLHRLDAETLPDTGNVFLSPFSILQAMTMVMNGTGGETQNELLRGLHLEGTDLSTVNKEQKALRMLLSSAKKNSEDSLLIADSLWVDQNLTLAPTFVSVAKDFYGAPATTLNFQDATGAAKEINHWVDTNTQGKIKTLFTGYDLVPAPSLVLANAVYFKAAWLTPFSETDTSPKPFTLESGVQKSLPMMQQARMDGFEDGVSYCKGDGFAMASLAYDYKTPQASRSMLLLLPDAAGCSRMQPMVSTHFYASLPRKTGANGRKV